MALSQGAALQRGLYLEHVPGLEAGGCALTTRRVRVSLVPLVPSISLQVWCEARENGATSTHYRSRG